MLSKLSFRNMKKSIRDYNIYFLTLVMGVAIFYMFNSLDGQKAMLRVSHSTMKVMDLMINILGIVSLFVAVVLALLIVYANRFMVNRRKKEFGVYLTLGMGKWQVSGIILLETLVVGIISLVVGIAVGIFASQFMSIFVAKLFDADMTGFVFTFSAAACIKTALYFAIMYIVVILVQSLQISSYKLIDLLTASRKNEKIHTRNPIISVLVFLIACGMLGVAYHGACGGVQEIMSARNYAFAFGKLIALGVVGTVLVFWSVAGFLLSLVKSNRNVYLKGTNLFVLRQLNNKINTNVISMAIISLLLFMTISALSSSLALKRSLQAQTEEFTPVDVTISSDVKNGESVQKLLEENGMDMSLLKDLTEVTLYEDPALTWETFLGNDYETTQKEYPMLMYESLECLMKVSDYNRIAKLYGNETYELSDGEYLVLCNMQSMKEIRDKTLHSGNHKIQVNGQTLQTKENSCQDGFVQMANAQSNLGVILVPDSMEFPEEMKDIYLLAANYTVKGNDEAEKVDAKIDQIMGSINTKLEEGNEVYAYEKNNLVNSGIGLSAIVIFIAIYLGIIFLIASSAILALKQLTESSDNRERYQVLRKIGCDEKMINRTLFVQIGIYFLMPMLVAILHSVFGIKFAVATVQVLMGDMNLLPSILISAALIGCIYLIYFFATYLSSKRIIKG